MNFLRDFFFFNVCKYNDERKTKTTFGCLWFQEKKSSSSFKKKKQRFSLALPSTPSPPVPSLPSPPDVNMGKEGRRKEREKSKHTFVNKGERNSRALPPLPQTIPKLKDKLRPPFEAHFPSPLVLYLCAPSPLHVPPLPHSPFSGWDRCLPSEKCLYNHRTAYT